MSSKRYTVDNAAIMVVLHATEDAQYELCCEGDQPYFLLRAKNHQVIGHSEHYRTERAARNGIQSVKQNALTQDIRDLTHG